MGPFDSFQRWKLLNGENKIAKEERGSMQSERCISTGDEMVLRNCELIV